MVEEKLRQLQQMAERAIVGSSAAGTPAASASPSSLSSSACPKSHWQQIGNLLLYTAAGVRGSEKVRSLVLKDNSGLGDQTIVTISPPTILVWFRVYSKTTGHLHLNVLGPFQNNGVVILISKSSLMICLLVLYWI